jgi:RNA polymerase sigma factor
MPTAGENLDERLWAAARAGDREARERLLAAYRPFVRRVAARAAGRYLVDGQDEEVSIGLIAFNEAIERYDGERGASFLAFAEMVIRRRLVDHYRSRGRQRDVPLSTYDREDEEGFVENPIVRAADVDAWQRAEEDEARRLEIEAYKAALAAYGIDLRTLVAASPKHADARASAQAAARQVAADPELWRQLESTRRLPIKELAERTGLSRKTLERQRTYIVAVAVALAGPFEHLHAYLRGGAS